LKTSILSAFGAGLIGAITACSGSIGDNQAGGSGAGSAAGGTPGAGAGSGSGAGGAGAGSGASGSSAGGSGAVGARCDQVGVDTGSNVLRRLSLLEYQLTLQDLFQLPAPPNVDGIPADRDKDGFRTHADLQTVSSQHLRAYLEHAAALADSLLADPTRTAAVIGCALDAPTCLTDFVTRFGKLAYRRSLEASEIDALVAAANENALDEPDRFRYVIEVLLSSPSFLYRVEVGDTPEGLSTLTPLELASRLSFALWGRAPSEELLDQAASGALDTPAGLAQVAARLLEDPRAQLFFKSFFKQWLGYEQLRAPKEPPADWDDALLPAMAEETDLVLDDFAWTGKSFLDVLTTNTTRLGPDLGAFYGLQVTSPNTLVEFDPSHPRANTGLLTHASLLSAKTDGDRISIRGNWLRKTFLCQSLHVPPELAEDFGELLVGLTRTEIVQKRNTEATCQGCHAAIDPIGIGFEVFDATGRYDPSVDISEFGIAPAFPDAPDPEFGSIAELAQKLQALPQVAECLTERAFLYTNGREPTQADACNVASAAEGFSSSSFDFPALVRGLVEDPAFRLRRAPTESE